MPSDTCAIILAGGQGTRIRHLHPDVPKPLVPVAGQPFVEWVIRHLADQGVRRFVVSVGHLANVACDHFAAPRDDALRIDLVEETQPLGTGGAVRLAAAACPEASVLLVANGDSLVPADLAPCFRRIAGPDVDAVLLAVEVDDASRYGQVRFDSQGCLVQFVEKQPGRGAINAGLYLFRRHTIDAFPRATPLSLERDVFPALLAQGKQVAVETCKAPLLDIGTPESLAEADAFVSRWFAQEAPR